VNRPVLLVLLTLFCSSCVSYTPYPYETQAPVCTIAKISLPSNDGKGGAITLRIENRNPFPLTIHALHLRMTNAKNDQQEAVSFAWKKEFEIKEFDTTEITLISSDGLASLVKDARGRNAFFSYHITGDVDVKTRPPGRTFLIDQSGKTVCEKQAKQKRQ